MKFAAILALLLAAPAAAFAPIKTPAIRSTLSATSPDGLGIDPGPLGLFDPLGMLEDTEGFARRRAVEIKHGRIAMMAFVGMASLKPRIDCPAFDSPSLIPTLMPIAL